MKESKRVLARAVARELTAQECEQVEGANTYSYTTTTSGTDVWGNPKKDDSYATDLEE
jgi:hypothetical protein